MTDQQIVDVLGSVRALGRANKDKIIAKSGWSCRVVDKTLAYLRRHGDVVYEFHGRAGGWYQMKERI